MGGLFGRLANWRVSERPSRRVGGRVGKWMSGLVDVWLSRWLAGG